MSDVGEKTRLYQAALEARRSDPLSEDLEEEVAASWRDLFSTFMRHALGYDAHVDWSQARDA